MANAPDGVVKSAPGQRLAIRWKKVAKLENKDHEQEENYRELEQKPRELELHRFELRKFSAKLEALIPFSRQMQGLNSAFRPGFVPPLLV